ncbi:MAG TPA: mechanosensitive ion channel [Nitrospira sp.]|nr:mechanosensitive ion channel family protein [Nitrospira sp. NTP1]HQR14596.1 mechanosensitive ion channel [Nitrospira sp.]HQV10087.1 mechanosensitive ion channel [Nitrospira sp.]
MSLANLITQYAVQYGFRIMGAVVVIIAALFVANSVGRLFERWLNKQDLEPPLRLLLLRLLKALLVILGVLIALDQLGVQIAPLVAGLGVAGLGVGLALQGVLSNVVAGLSIIFTKPYRVGEHISLLGVHGDVAKIDIFTTTLLHPDHSRIVIPNRKVVGEILHNFGTIRQLDLSIGVSYQTDIETTLRVLRELVARHPNVLQDPVPIIGIAAFADSSITLSIRPWVPVASVGSAHSELNQAIIQRLRADGVDIPFPQREVRLLNPS